MTGLIRGDGRLRCTARFRECGLREAGSKAQSMDFIHALIYLIRYNGASRRRYTYSRQRRQPN